MSAEGLSNYTLENWGHYDCSSIRNIMRSDGDGWQDNCSHIVNRGPTGIRSLVDGH
jgi:hypothetical protein